MQLANKIHEEKKREFSIGTAVALASRFVVPGYNSGTEHMVVDCINRGILIAERDGYISFGHLTYQEYLSAKYVMQYSAIQSLKEKIGDNWWENVLILYASIVGDISSFLKLIPVQEQMDNKELLYKMAIAASLTDIDKYPILKELTGRYDIPSSGTSTGMLEKFSRVSPGSYWITDH